MPRRKITTPEQLLESLKRYNAVLDRLGVPALVTTAEAETWPVENLREVVTATADKVTHVTRQLRGLL